MGIINHGILGGFRKKVGPVVGTHWRSLAVIKALPRVGGKARSTLQLDQQLKFGMVSRFLSRISPLVDIGFHEQGR